MTLLGWILCLSAQVCSAEQPLRVIEDQATLSIQQGAATVLVYNKQAPPLPEDMDEKYLRSGFLHPVRTPNGGEVTAVYPRDHAHQDGIFSAWVKATYDGQPVDFWNIAKGLGRVAHHQVVSKFAQKDVAGFEIQLIHRTQGDKPVDVLLETWRVTAHRTDGSYFAFDIEAQQSALTDKPLTVEEYHYGGMALRGPTKWVLDKNASNESQPVSGMLTSNRSDRKEGNHESVKWVALTGQGQSKRATPGVATGVSTVAVLSHPQNFRAPQKTRLHPTKPYFCFATCVDGSFVIEKGKPIRNRYRYLLTDQAPDAAWLDEQWKSWSGEE